ncbi:MAG: hypothetical protein H6737_13205 [Alphaproteobacteria bacterium]|nr:hypothetical protein [Alphaproteobacteria bacterium]
MATNTNLESLLFRIRDGVATVDEIVRARELVVADSRLPDELKEVVDFEDDPEGDAVGLLAVLGADSLFGEVLREGLEAELALGVMDAIGAEPEVTADMVDGVWDLGEVFVAAVHYEAGEVDVLDAVFVEAGLALESLHVAEAVRFEAGEVDLSDAIVAAVGGEARVPLAEAVRAEAGEIEIALEVLARCGLEAHTLPLAAAIAGEAGSVDLVSDIESALTDLGMPLAAAIASEAGRIDIADSVLAAIGGEARLPIAEAVRAEAGVVDVWPDLEAVVSDAWVSAMLDHELSPAAHRAAVLRLREAPEAGALMTAFASLGSEIRTAVRAEAGECPYIWEAVAEAIGVEAEAVEGWDGALFAAAVRAEAGSVDVANDVLRAIGAVRRPAIPYSAVEVEAVPAPANSRRWNVGTLVMAAAAALLLTVAPFGLQNSRSVGGTHTASVEAPSPQFASAGEITVENLDYHDEASVTQTLGDEGALILWVDEEATL